MTGPQTRQYILATLPADSPYYGQPGKVALPQSERLALGLSDPAFVWNVLSSHHQSGLPLPSQPTKCFLRAGVLLRNLEFRADEVEAVALTHPRCAAQRELLEALLICPDLGIEAIAKHLGLAPAVVEFFHDCFFAVRDRMNERSFILGIVYPNGRLASLELASETPGQRLKRIAYEQGSEALLRITGLAGKSEDEPLEDGKRVQAIERRLLKAADEALLAGRGNEAEVPALDRAMKPGGPRQACARRGAVRPSIPEGF